MADSLPDRYGTRLIEVWLQKQGRSLQDFNPIERLCYMGNRRMGALEFEPALVSRHKAVRIEVSELVRLTGRILSQREDLLVNLSEDESAALDTVIRVGTSAGGARAKAVIAWNPKDNDIRSGQVQAPKGFWNQQIKSYTLQVEPGRYKYDKNQVTISYQEALRIQDVRGSFFSELRNLLHRKRQAHP